MTDIPYHSIPYPHCDSRVLHAPGECEHCDHYPERQRARQNGRVAFTGHEPTEDQLPCPADAARPPGSTSDHRRWYGNVATSQEPVDETEASKVLYFRTPTGSKPWSDPDADPLADVRAAARRAYDAYQPEPFEMPPALASHAEAREAFANLAVQKLDIADWTPEDLERLREEVWAPTAPLQARLLWKAADVVQRHLPWDWRPLGLDLVRPMNLVYDLTLSLQHRAWRASREAGT